MEGIWVFLVKSSDVGVIENEEVQVSRMHFVSQQLASQPGLEHFSVSHNELSREILSLRAKCQVQLLIDSVFLHTLWLVPARWQIMELYLDPKFVF